MGFSNNGATSTATAGTELWDEGTGGGSDFIAQYALQNVPGSGSLAGTLSFSDPWSAFGIRMVAAPITRTNSFEGGSDGTSITPGNSGGASGTPFDVVTLGAGSTQNFSATHAAHGSLGMEIVTPASTPLSTRVEWTGIGSLTGNLWIRFYLYRLALPSANFLFTSVRNNAGAASGNFLISTNGKLNMQNAAGTSQGASTGTAMALNQWVRFEIRILSSTTAGEGEIRMYNTADAAIGSETDSMNYGAAMVLGANSDQTRIGMVTNPLASDTSYFDDLAISTVGWIGPAGTPPPPPNVGKRVGLFTPEIARKGWF
jgi:hypothetical protein